MHILEGFYRHDITKLLKKQKGNVGIELGVAEGVFSSRMVKSGIFSKFFGIDKYDDIHDIVEYKTALKNVGLLSNYSLLKMTFDEAIELFDDESIDFIYIDGYAYNGENGGRTIIEWSRKVKIGGVIAGDDYHTDWPLVLEAVNYFIDQSGFELNVTSETEKNPYSRYPSWAVIKKHTTNNLRPSQQLIKKGLRARRHSISEQIKILIKNIVKRVLSRSLLNIIRRFLRR